MVYRCHHASICRANLARGFLCYAVFGEIGAGEDIAGYVSAAEEIGIGWLCGLVRIAVREGKASKKIAVRLESNTLNPKKRTKSVFAYVYLKYMYIRAKLSFYPWIACWKVWFLCFRITKSMLIQI